MTEIAVLALSARLFTATNNDIIINTMSQDSNTYLSRLEYLALYDPLTELPNRALLLDRLQNMISLSLRETQPFTLVLLNIDHLSEINESLGHHNGDLVVKQIAARLHKGFRESDTVARLGGDEFALLLSETDEMQASRIAHKIQEILEPPFLVEDIPLIIEGSIGLAVYPQHGEDAKSLIQKAGVALRIARSTRCGFSVYDASEEPHTLHRLTLMSELRDAINQGQLVLHYQPKVNLKSRNTTEVEALVRWNHPVRGQLSPAEFIPLAEQTGLIKPLTFWVLDSAMSQCQNWNRMGKNITIAVNISARNLIDPQLPDMVAQILQTWDIDPGKLILEITETAIMTRPERAIEILTCLKKMGIRLSIDDFGTGYSSLGHLKSLPVSELKIDRSFVSSATANNGDAIIMSSTITLGKNFGLEVVAEGVENQETWELLKALGCDKAQGYYMSRPLTADQLIIWMESAEWQQ